MILLMKKCNVLFMVFGRDFIFKKYNNKLFKELSCYSGSFYNDKELNHMKMK